MKASKLIHAVNAMIEKKDRISNVIAASKSDQSEEYFFLFDEKYKWSIMHNLSNDQYNLYFYPKEAYNNMTIAQISQIDDWSENNLVAFLGKDFQEPEEIESFKELFVIVAGKAYNLDVVFDDIINS